MQEEGRSFPAQVEGAMVQGCEEVEEEELLDLAQILKAQMEEEELTAATDLSSVEGTVAESVVVSPAEGDNEGNNQEDNEDAEDEGSTGEDEDDDSDDDSGPPPPLRRLRDHLFLDAPALLAGVPQDVRPVPYHPWWHPRRPVAPDNDDNNNNNEDDDDSDDDSSHSSLPALVRRQVFYDSSSDDDSDSDDDDDGPPPLMRRGLPHMDGDHPGGLFIPHEDRQRLIDGIFDDFFLMFMNRHNHFFWRRAVNGENDDEDRPRRDPLDGPNFGNVQLCIVASFAGDTTIANGGGLHRPNFKVLLQGH